ncbi:MAG: hypothetical protein ABEI06_06390 [Halobacteriaceae archaeon]
MAGCIGGGSQGRSPSPTVTDTQILTTKSGKPSTTNGSHHYFHHEYSSTNATIQKAISIAITNETVSSIIGSNYTVINAWWVANTKHHRCSNSRCIIVSINYWWGHLDVHVDIESGSVWDIDQHATPKIPPAQVSQQKAAEIALNHANVSNESVTLQAFADKTVTSSVTNSGATDQCRYHGCYAVIIRESGSGDLRAVVIIDKITGKVLLTDTNLSDNKGF